ncbi:MAG: DNA repair protein RecN, partial [Armatimonadota bacterium]|nr:DNA repair protein RecN [Armatimonadota bacterium]
NGRAAPASVVREITAYLVDLHGQHEHQSLLSTSSHRNIFDDWLGPEAQSLRNHIRIVWSELQTVLDELERLRANDRDRARLLDLYKYQLEEIRAAELKCGEEEELLAERNRLANSEKLLQASAEIYTLLSTDGTAIDCLSEAAAAAEKTAAIDPEFSRIAENLQTALAAAQEAAIAVREYQEEIDVDPKRLDEIEDRLDLIRRLKRKYGDTIDDIIRYASDLSAKLEELDNTEERLSEMEHQANKLEAELREACERLTALRKNGAADFKKRVEQELADLAMENARFEVSIEPAEPGPSGADTVEFLISPNPGEPVKPLAKIASGGEISRIMLALKTLTKKPEVPVLVFDEIDVGIGGVTAQVLGEKLASLASQCQVLCVTHLPQIASKADTQIGIEKAVVDERTVVTARKLTGEARVIEIARMLGDDSGSEAATLHAREMLQSMLSSKRSSTTHHNDTFASDRPGESRGS